MSAQKPKLDKHKHSARTWLDRLFGARHIDFVAPLALEEYVSLLQQNRRSSLGYSNAEVNLRQIDDDTYEIDLSEAYRSMPLIGAKGYLKRWEERTTLVTATTKPSRIGASFYLYYSAKFLCGRAYE